MVLCSRGLCHCHSVCPLRTAEIGLLRFNGFQNGVVRHLGFIGTASPPHVVLDAGYSYACQDVAWSVFVTTAGPAQMAERIELPFVRNGQNVQH